MSRTTNDPFGRALEVLMEKRKLTFRGLAKESGYSAGYLNHLVHGNRPVPSDAIIARLAEVMNVRPDYFLETRLRRSRRR